MKRLAFFLFLISGLTASAYSLTFNNTAICLFASSYDEAPYHYSDYVGSGIALGNPQLTNDWNSCSGSGSILDANQTRLERLGLGHWAHAAHAIGIIQVDDNGGFSAATQNTELTNTFHAPALLYNGTSYTDVGGWASTHSITWIGVGCPPHDSTDGDSGQIARNNALTNVCAQLGLQGIDVWNPVWNNGWSNDNNGAKLLGFNAGSHPYLAGDLCMAITITAALAGADTNVSQSIVDWNTAAIVLTNHCVLSSASRTGNTLTFTRHDDRLPMAWDVPDGTITNDCSAAFTAMPTLANAFRFLLGLTNQPAGSYYIEIGGVHVATLTETQLGNWNMFTNTVGPYWVKRVAVLGLIRDKNGANRVTLLDHFAGDSGVNGRDLVNYASDAQNAVNAGHHGDALVTALASDLTSLDGYNLSIYTAAQPENEVITITRIVPRYAAILK